MNNVNTSNFCLAHLLTLIDFPGGVAGLAYDRICDPDYNIGFTTLKNHGVRKISYNRLHTALNGVD